MKSAFLPVMTLLAEVRSALREHDPDGVMVGEGFTDMTAQCCDGFWSWSQLRFSEIIRYSVPWLAYSHEIDPNEYADVNTCFINRILLDLKIEGVMEPLRTSQSSRHTCGGYRISRSGWDPPMSMGSTGTRRGSKWRGTWPPRSCG